MLCKLGNICCGHEMFLNKIRNIFCAPDTKFVCTRAQANLCRQQCVLVCQGLYAYMYVLVKTRINRHLSTTATFVHLTRLQLHFVLLELIPDPGKKHCIA